MPARPRSFKEIQSALRAGTTSVRALVSRSLDEAATFAPEAWISRLGTDVLLHQADAHDAWLRSEGDAAFSTLPLLGLTFAVKDNIDVAGLRTTAACPGFALDAAVCHAFVVQRLVDAGAVCIGKTNLDQFATGLVGTRSPHGAVPNPLAPDHVSGGSSSGSAYVVATGQVSFSLGTDTAGSGRIPAGFNHITGLKPTRGWLSTRGVLPACRSLDCVSIFALRPEDAWQTVAIAAAVDRLDPFSRPMLAPRLRADRVDGLRIGLPEPLEFFGDHAAARAFDTVIATLERLGCRWVPLPFAPFTRAGSLLYDGPWIAERYAAVRGFLEGRPPGADPTVAGLILSGAAPRAHELFAAQHELQALQSHAARIWQDVDVMLVPTAPTHPTQAEVHADPVMPNRRLGHYTNFVNLLDLAAHAFPGPFRDDGLPAGVTLIGPAFSDFALAQLASRLARELEPTSGAMRHDVGPAPALAAAEPAQPVRIVAVGAHMSGLALNWQFIERAARCVAVTRTAPVYRLHSLTGREPTRPGLVHVGAADGQAIEVEVWELDTRHVGSFLSLVGPPLAIGTVELADGSSERGFVCEPRGVAPGSGALDITGFGGWRAFVDSLAATASR